jgi:hypothetical protein
VRDLLDALRWHDRDERKALWWAAALGVFGVVTGYLVFAVVRHEAEHDELETFLAAVVIAAVVSYGWECLNELIKHGRVYKEDAPEPILVRAAGTFFVVLLLELFISAWHKGTEYRHTFLAGLLELMVRGAAADPPWAAVVGISVVWVALGALMSWLLVAVILRMAPSLEPATEATGREERTAFWVSSGLAGLGTGVLVALVVLALLLLFRFSEALASMVFDHAYWRANLDNLAASTPTMAWMTAPLLWLDDAIRHAWLVPATLLFGGLVLVGLGKLGLALALVAVTWSVFFPALVSDYERLWILLKASVLLWLVPALALGLALPLLRGPKPREWSIIAGGAGLLLAGLAASQAGRWSMIWAAIGAFALAAFLFTFSSLEYRDGSIMFLAAVNGLAIYGLALVPATALGVANDFVFMSTRPGLGLDHLSPPELERLSFAPTIDRDIQADPEFRRAVPGPLTAVYERLRGLKDLRVLAVRAAEVKAIDEALTAQRTAPMPGSTVGGLGMDRRSNILLRRAVWLDRATGSVKRLRVRTEQLVRGEGIREGLPGDQTNAPAQLNASLGGAIGYTVTLALLAAWRVKDLPAGRRRDADHPGG